MEVKMEKLTKQDHQNLLVFLGRVDLKGSESTAHAMLMQKLSLLVQTNELEKKEIKKVIKK